MWTTVSETDSWFKVESVDFCSIQESLELDFEVLITEARGGDEGGLGQCSGRDFGDNADVDHCVGCFLSIYLGRV